MRLEHLFIAGFAIILITSLGYTFYADILNDFNIDTTEAEGIRNISYSYDDMYGHEQGIKTSISEGTLDEDNVENDMYREMYTGIRSRPFSVMGLVGDTIQRLGGQFTTFIPKDVLVFIGVVIGILTVFAVIYLIRGIAQR